MAHLFFVFVVLSEMKDFEVLNKVYKTFFGVNPPSRACVAVRTTTRVRAEVWGVCPVREATIPMTSEEWGAIRHGLHVQSLSEWAPACIGPYSQAQGIDLPNDAGRLWWLAGQIGLQPSTLTLAAPHDPIAQLHLTLRHITRILDSTTQHRLHLVSLLHGVLYFVPSLLSPTLLCEHLPLDWKMRLLCVAVSELPRHAAVEVQMLAHETTASVASSNIKHLSFIENVRLMDESDFATLCRITYSFDNFVIATLICYGPSPLVTSVPFDRLVLCALTHLATQLYHCHSIESLASPSQFWSHCLNVRLWYHPALVTTSEEFDLAMQRIQLQETSLPPLVAYPSQWTHLFAENTSNPSLPPSHVPYVTVCCEMYRYG
jgi:enamine deaminase RidA (YjgF/YER057c/UK114 family)